MKFRPISEKKLRALKLLAAQRRKTLPEMEFQATHADKSYFNRSWKREDLFNFSRTPEYSHRILKRVYLTLFSTMLAATYGSYVHLIWEVGGLFTVFSSVASLLCLLFTSWRVNHRVLLLMIAAFFLGASGGLFTRYFLKIDEDFVVKLLAAASIVFGCFWSAAWTNRERRQIYMGGLFLTVNLMRFMFDSYTTHLVLKVHVILAVFMIYLMIYSQEILYDARSRDIDIVNRTLTIFFDLPAIVVHAARVLFLGANIEQQRQN